MSLIARPRWTRQPQGAVEVDWSNPLTRGMVSCLEMRGSNVRDLASTLVFNHTVPIVGTTKGRAPGFAGTGISTGVTSIRGQGLFATSTNPFTVMVLCRRTASGTFLARASATVANRTFQIVESSSVTPTGTPAIYIRGSETLTNLGHTDTNWHLYTVAYNGSTATLFADASSSVALTVGTAAEETAENITIGSRSGTTGFPLTGNVAFVRIWSRALTQREHKQFWSNPWQIFKPVTRTIALSGAVVQLLRPDGDISSGAWLPSTGSDLYAMLDETTADDGDYIYTTSTSTAEVSLTNAGDPAVSTGHIIRYRAKGTGNLTVKLMQGTTTIATHVPTLTTSFQTFTFTLSGAEADSITDYSNLRLQFVSS